MRTSLRNVKSFFLDFLNMRIFQETVRNNLPSIPHEKYESSGYFVYDEQYSYIQGVEHYRVLLKDSKTGKSLKRSFMTCRKRR